MGVQVPLGVLQLAHSRRCNLAWCLPPLADTRVVVINGMRAGNLVLSSDQWNCSFAVQLRRSSVLVIRRLTAWLRPSRREKA
jgi:hypothetical protein